jgi:hypothetical protein
MDNDQERTPVNYIELTLKQADVVDEAANRHKESPGKDTEMQIEIELEKLCFYQASAKGNPKMRAQQAAESARAIVLARAITPK